jgi:hypothetical protein
MQTFFLSSTHISPDSRVFFWTSSNPSSEYLHIYKNKSIVTSIHYHSYPCCILKSFFYLVCEAIGTEATPGLLCQPRVIVKMIVENQMEWRLARETEVLWEYLSQRHFCPSQNRTLPGPGLNSGRRGRKLATIILLLLLLLLVLFGLWGYWHCGHSWPIVPTSGDSEDVCGEADGM